MFHQYLKATRILGFFVFNMFYGPIKKTVELKNALGDYP